MRASVRNRVPIQHAPRIQRNVLLHVWPVPPTHSGIGTQRLQSLLFGWKRADVGFVHFERGQELLHLCFDGGGAIDITLAEQVWRDEEKEDAHPSRDPR